MIDADADAGALLLERIEPGRMLAEERDDDGAMAIAAELMMGLWRPAPEVHAIRSVERWGRSLERLHDSGNPGPIPDAMVRAGQAVFERARRSDEQTLLHADFHQLNVLQRADGSWVVIDPKGAVGDRGYEFGPLLTNVLACDDPVEQWTGRVPRCARGTAQT